MDVPLVFVLSNGMDVKEYSKYISNIHNQQLWLILSSSCSFHQVSYVSRGSLLLYKYIFSTLAKLHFKARGIRLSLELNSVIMMRSKNKTKNRQTCTKMLQL